MTTPPAGRCPTCGQPLASTLLTALRDARVNAGLNGREFGRLLSPPRTHAAVSDIERGKTRITIDLLLQWGRICGVDPAMLFGQAMIDEDRDGDTETRQRAAR